MIVVISKLIIVLLCILFGVDKNIDLYFIASLFLSILISSLMSFYDKKTKFFLMLSFVALIYIMPKLIIFTPLLVYDIYDKKRWQYSLVLLIPLLIVDMPILELCILITLSLLSVILKTKDTTLINTTSEFLESINDSREQNISLYLQNKTILEQEEQKIELAILKERNRIAKNIHDDVGHLITRSLLQIGALSLANKDEKINKDLLDIKKNLDESMNQIRESIHDIHKASIDLKSTVAELINDFTFCKVRFEYNIYSTLPINISYSMSYILKECLTNVMKHSNATEVRISFNELADKYTFLIIDNGSKISENNDEGMGIYSIIERVKSFDGKVNIYTNNGYRILITLDKEVV